MSDMDRGLLNATADAAIALDERVDRLEDPPQDPRQEAVDRGLPRDLLGTEQSVWQRLTPGRNPWPEIGAFDVRVAELEARQSEISAELQRLVERKSSAPARDAERLGEWQLGGEEGPRPEPELPAIEKEIERLQADWEGLTRAVAKVLGEKVAFVKKHRGRLVKEAAKQREEAHARYLEHVDQLERERAELLALREAELWAQLHPTRESVAPLADSFCGGRRLPLKAMQLDAMIQPEKVFTGLREDARWVNEAASPEQRQALAGRDTRARKAKAGAAVWVNSDEHRERLAAERQAAIDAYVREWGTIPDWAR